MGAGEVSGEGSEVLSLVQATHRLDAGESRLLSRVERTFTDASNWCERWRQVLGLIPGKAPPASSGTCFARRAPFKD